MRSLLLLALLGCGGSVVIVEDDGAGGSSVASTASTGYSPECIWDDPHTLWDGPDCCVVDLELCPMSECTVGAELCAGHCVALSIRAGGPCSAGHCEIVTDSYWWPEGSVCVP